MGKNTNSLDEKKQTCENTAGVLLSSLRSLSPLLTIQVPHLHTQVYEGSIWHKGRKNQIYFFKKSNIFFKKPPNFWSSSQLFSFFKKSFLPILSFLPMIRSSIIGIWMKQSQQWNRMREEIIEEDSVDEKKRQSIREREDQRKRRSEEERDWWENRIDSVEMKEDSDRWQARVWMTLLFSSLSPPSHSFSPKTFLFFIPFRDWVDVLLSTSFFPAGQALDQEKQTEIRLNDH